MLAALLCEFDIAPVEGHTPEVIDNLVGAFQLLFTFHFSLFSSTPAFSDTKYTGKDPLIPPRTSSTPPQLSLKAPPIPQKALTLSRNMDACRPLQAGADQRERSAGPPDAPPRLVTKWSAGLPHAPPPPVTEWSAGPPHAPPCPVTYIAT